MRDLLGVTCPVRSDKEPLTMWTKKKKKRGATLPPKQVSTPVDISRASKQAGSHAVTGESGMEKEKGRYRYVRQ